MGKSNIRRYIIYFYTTIISITTIVYGDYTPVTYIEMIYLIIVAIITSGVVSYIFN